MGSIVQRSKGSWTIVYDLPRGATQKRHQKKETIRGTKKQAEQLLRQRETDIQNGTYVEPTSQSLEEFLEKWLVDYAAVQVSPTTLRTYQVYLRRHVVPALGRVPLVQLTPIQIQGFYHGLLQSGRKRGDGGLSRQTVEHIHVILRGALNRAVKWGILSRNPCLQVDAPKVPQKEASSLTEEQVGQLLTAIQGTKLAAPVYLSLGAGLRRGEVLGLTWADIDLENGELTVRRSVMAVDGHLAVKEPKTNTSLRTLPLPECVLPVLVWHRGEQAKHRLRMGQTYRDQGIVIAGKKGDWLYPDTLTEWFADVAKQIGLDCTFHSLRHAYTSLMVRYGVDLSVVSKMAGHADISTTQRVYTHIQKDQRRAAADRLDEGLKRAMGDQ